MGRLGLMGAALLAASAGCDGALPEPSLNMGQEGSGLDIGSDAGADGFVAPDAVADTAAETAGPDIDEPDQPRVAPDVPATQDAGPDDATPELPPAEDVPTTTEDVPTPPEDVAEDVPACECELYYADFDGDGFGTGEPDCLCAPIGAFNATQGGDCCDSDALAHPGSDSNAWYDEANGCGDFDYDCDGEQTPRWTSQGGCDGVAVLCEHTAGWFGDAPACGVESPWVQNCNLGCNEVVDGRTQACR